MKWCVGYPYTIGEGLCLLFLQIESQTFNLQKCL